MPAKERYPLRGLVVSLNAPFDEHDRLDLPSVERAVEMHLREGAAGFLVPAQAAEVLALTLPERLLLVRTVRELARGRSIVIAGATADDPRESLAMAEHAAALGCEGVLSEPPQGAPADLARLLEFFGAFASAGVPMLMIQDLDWGGAGMPVPVIVELFERIEPFRCLKVEVVPAGPKYTAVLAATGARLHVSGGWAALQMIEALDRGVDVFMNTAFTRFYQGVLDAHAACNRELAWKRFRRILPLLAFGHQHLDVSIQFYKRLFLHLGIFSTPRCRKKCLPWDSYHETVSRDLIKYLDSLEEYEPE